MIRGRWPKPAVQSPMEAAAEAVGIVCSSSDKNPSIWKWMDESLSSGTLCPLHLLSLLTSRLIPLRRSLPLSFRLYLHLLPLHALSSSSAASTARLVRSVDDALRLSHSFNVPITDLGRAFVFFLFTLVSSLLDSALEDFLQIDSTENLLAQNAFTALEVLAKVTNSRKAKVLLRLVYLNLPQKFDGLLQGMQSLEARLMKSASLDPANQFLKKISANIFSVMELEYQLNNRKFIGLLVYGCPGSSASGRSTCWVSFDIYMEHAMDGRHLPVRSVVAILSEMIYALKVINQASWQETFLELWLSALRLVQREREPLEGPIPHLAARLCVLLSIVPLAIANIMRDDTRFPSFSCHESMIPRFVDTGYGRGLLEKEQASRRHGLDSSLQLLGNFSGLLCPPASVVDAANSAQARAASFISKSKSEADGSGGGNMWHLIVEACISRNLIDTSAYFWPGFLSTLQPLASDVTSAQSSPWLAFMEGAALSGPLVNLLINTPASSVAEIEKLYRIALGGSTQEKAMAAKILCGASLSHGWNIQEHVVHFIVKLLSPPAPPGYSGQESHLIDDMPMLSAILFGVSSVDNVHILSLHGVVPEVAAALLPLCEVFGSLAPAATDKLKTGDETSVYMVFSAAFLFLLRLWKFYKPPLEQCLAGGPIGVELSLEYLLLLRNNRISSNDSPVTDGNCPSIHQSECASDKPVYIDFFPKLRAWHCQNKSCLASTLSSLSTSSPVHQTANKILSMIFSKMSKGGPSSGNSSTLSGSSSISESPVVLEDDAQQQPTFPAWEVLEAIPYVLEAILSACTHGRLSSRDMTTGLRDLVDFLPASLAAIISYFSAEVTRGIWKPVPMNGTDWPSPAAILPTVESEMKQVLSTAGVNTRICSSSEDSQAMLPLPVAALVSLTITFKLTKNLEYIHAVAGPALENCASGCAWPSIPIISSLWAQKVRRWHDFIVVACSRSVFRQNKEALSQILRSCFTSFLRYSSNSTSMLNKDKSIHGLLGSILGAQGKFPTLAPGFLYLRSCRTIQNVECVNNMIIGLVVEKAGEATVKWMARRGGEKSLWAAAEKAREVGMLGASLMAVTGGLRLVQELYQETVATWMLTWRNREGEGEGGEGEEGRVGRIMQGYALAYMVVVAGSMVWGVGPKPPSYSVSKTRKSRMIGAHMEFMVRVVEGKVSVGCDGAMWKAYVACVVGLIVTRAPAWVQPVRLHTLQKLARSLSAWHDSHLALSLLERAGLPAFHSFFQLLNSTAPFD
ncbi:PREDICTED: mediator of RNA polymerase II transcription subunit 33A-like isoform X2 [Tarenaya hassleriana]|uniref:mediator of RNA polymerase II transcription subunit 33A-like isoform X2 n=1 Tax=Tarenaya hassleriana TaxID=28532 RepID=UPI00053C70D3|nr:PREDICTED: mediator of RNA polymerase II transcription subunit 33A-like isoform X2 [Tarenaya hassleriana]